MTETLNRADVIAELAKLDADYIRLKKDCDEYYRNASHDPRALARMEARLRRLARKIQKIKQPDLL